MKNNILIPAIILIFITWSCHNNEEVNSHTSIEARKDSLIRMSVAQLASAGLEYGTFSQKSMGEGLTLNAQLVVHPEHKANVTAFSEGIISEIRTTLNASVRKGQVLAVIRFPELLDLQHEFLENKDRLSFLGADYERYRTLQDADATASRNFQKAETELKAALTVSKVLAAKLRQYQINPETLTADKLSTDLKLTAPVNGIISAINAGAGTAVQPGTSVFEITDMSQLHADLWIFEKDIMNVKTGQKVSLYFPANKTQVYSATIFSLDQTLDPDKRALRAHARLEPAMRNSSNFVNGSFLEAFIMTKEGTLSQALPEEAVIKERHDDFIFILVTETPDEKEFRKIKVIRGMSIDGFVGISTQEPIPANAKIVIKGAYYVSAAGASIADEH